MPEKIQRADDKLQTGPLSRRLTIFPISPVVAFMQALIRFLSLGVKLTAPFSFLGGGIVTSSAKILVGLQEQCVSLYRRSISVPG